MCEACKVRSRRKMAGHLWDLVNKKALVLSMVSVSLSNWELSRQTAKLERWDHRLRAFERGEWRGLGTKGRA